MALMRYAKRNYVVERVTGRRSVRWIDYADTLADARKIQAAAKPVPGTVVQISDYRKGKIVS